MANKKSKEALSQIKSEAAQTVGVTLKQGYNGDLTSREAAGTARGSAPSCHPLCRG